MILSECRVSRHDDVRWSLLALRVRQLDLADQIVVDHVGHLLDELLHAGRGLGRVGLARATRRTDDRARALPTRLGRRLAGTADCSGWSRM